MTSPQSSPSGTALTSPSSSSASGVVAPPPVVVIVSGAVSGSFSFQPPPVCEFVNEGQLEFSVDNLTAALAFDIVGYHGVGDYTARPPSADLSQIAYDPGHWVAAEGAIHVLRADSTGAAGTVTATITQPDYVASADRLGDASVSGSWACAQPNP